MMKEESSNFQIEVMVMTGGKLYFLGLLNGSEILLNCGKLPSSPILERV
jgi:hypothetical protein